MEYPTVKILCNKKQWQALLDILKSKYDITLGNGFWLNKASTETCYIINGSWARLNKIKSNLYAIRDIN